MRQTFPHYTSSLPHFPDIVLPSKTWPGYQQNCSHIDHPWTDIFRCPYDSIGVHWTDGKNIMLCWIQSHVEILSNEKADAAAKSALSLPVTRIAPPRLDTCLPQTCILV